MLSLRMLPPQGRLSGKLFVNCQYSLNIFSVSRAINGPGCQMVGPTDDDNVCEFTWLMDCDYKGWMPQSVLDIAMPVAQTQFIECIRKLGAKMKSEGKF